MEYTTIRPYEMSVWSLRDSFIATLKAPGIENKGHIENPEIHLNLDGTEELSFQVPMYYYLEDEYIENPYWYDIKHGLLMVGLRKIKAIFNKNSKKERIFEFLITAVTEEHGDDGSLYCKVEGSGLAFQELGKKGTNISLSYDDLETEITEIEEQLERENEEKKWDKETYLAEKEKRIPVPTINYWCDKLFDNLDWTYSIQMEWSLYDGYVLVALDNVSGGERLPYVDIGLVNFASLNDDSGDIYTSILGRLKLGFSHLGWEQGIFYKGHIIIPYSSLDKEGRANVDNLRESLGLRRCDTLYEDEFVKYWDFDAIKERMVPAIIEKRREKQRIVEVSQSNIYNLTQSISETFEVYCKYKYYYDDNYRIIKKEIIFYNQLLNELDNKLDLTYAYGIKSITRNMDSNDVCTKLIVNTIDEENSDSGILSIMNASANKTGENYILNFKYLYQTGAISQDQYDEIAPYEYAMANYNRKLKSLSESTNQRAVDINNLKSDITLYKNSIEQSREQVYLSLSELKNLTLDEKTGISNGTLEIESIIYLSYDADTNTYFIDLTEKGILPESIKLYIVAENSTQFGVELAKDRYTIEYDNNNNVIGLKNIFDIDMVGIYYRYQPQLASTNVLNTFITKIRKDQIQLTVAEKKLETLEELQKTEEEEYNKLTKEKNARMHDFTVLMGPALREGSWDPDSYNNYTSAKIADIVFNAQDNIHMTEDYSYFWDTEPFDNEDKIYYESGINQEHINYPYILLTPEMITQLRKYFRNDNKNNLYFRYQEKLEPSIVFEEEYEEIDEEIRVKAYFFELITGEILRQQVDYDENINTEAAQAIAQEKLRNDILLYGLQTYTGQNETNLAAYSDIDKRIVAERYGLGIINYQYFALDNNMILSFLKTSQSNIQPVLLLTGIANLSDGQIEEVLAGGELGELNITTDMQEEIIDTFLNSVLDSDELEAIPNYSDYSSLVINEVFTTIIDNIVINEPLENDIIVYPRIKIPNFSFNTDNVTITSLNDELIRENLAELNKFVDFSIFSREDGYYITINSKRLLDVNINNYATDNFNPMQLQYEISNVELSIYLNALEISENNAFPQVSYEVSISALNTDLIQTSYDLLGRIAHINDYELKFENVMGYISMVGLKLDNPWEDTIEIQNYKTKFADLFTKIIASTQQMQSNVTLYNKAAAAFNSRGLLTTSVLQNSFSALNTDFNLNFKKGRLTIDSVEGIKAESDDGIVMMTGGGIYCATEKNNEGTWKWHSGILPTGINASLIKAGQLDTNLIRIFAGNDLRFQMNGEGLYAFGLNKDNTVNENEYVVYNSEGIFMTKRNMTRLYDDNGHYLNTPEIGNINRVAVSWEGFVLRNDKNERVFFADNQGNLTLTGTIKANAGLIGGWSIGKNSLNTIDTSTLIATAGMASGIMEDETNIVAGSSNIYKVFWAGMDIYGNSKFYVDSTGNVFANSLVVEQSLVASHLTLNGVPLEKVLPEVRDAEKGITITPLNGTTFNVLYDGSLQERSLEFSITAHDLSLDVSRINFSLSVSESEEEVGEDTGEEEGEEVGEDTGEEEGEGEEEEIEIEEVWTDITGLIEFNTISSTYLTFSVDYDIIAENEAKTSLIKVTFTDSNDVVYSDVISLNAVRFAADILTVKIFSDKGSIFSNSRVSVDNSNFITLFARVYRNGIEVTNPMDDYNFQWYYKQKIVETDNQQHTSYRFVDVPIENTNSNEISITPDNLRHNKSNTYVCTVTEKVQEVIISDDDGDEDLEEQGDD